ncbi:helicase-exonuclease AddAB subunit AddB [Bacillus gobiensis]|uniref:helicase-exonuclease AddAB subunit AddB n=1 Tax=Bacillus gobiensis TaxID=1441095 RepID=UPI003D21895E
MKVEFLVGRSGSGKTTAILNSIRDQLREDPLGKPIIFLVPDQMTFLMEYELAKTEELGGMIRAQVYSFSRLAWRILQQEGGMGRQFLGTTGVQMLLRKLIEEHKHEFKVYQKASDKSGFIKQAAAMITEFKQYALSPADLRQVMEGSSNSHFGEERVLADKLHDLYLLYQKLETTLEGHYLDSEDYLNLLSEKIPYSEEIKQAHVYVDGFHQFTAQEYRILEQLMIYSEGVTISLTADRPFTQHLPYELHLFRMTGKTFHKLYQKAKELNVEPEIVPFSETKRHLASPELAHLEKTFEARPTIPYGDAADGLTILEASNKRTEIEGIAREIHSLVRKGEYRYKDISILTRNTADYKETIQEVFKDYGLPFFIDGKEPMQNHPLIELLRSTMDMITGNWRYEAVFRCVKTELLYPLKGNKQKIREQIDQLENYCISYGIKGDQWTNNKRFQYRRYSSLDDQFPLTDQEVEMETMLNELREWISAPVYSLQKRLKKAKSVREMGVAFYTYLEEIQIPEKLDLLRQEAEDKGQVIEARQHDQVWNAVVQMLEEFVEMMGDTNISIQLFQQMIETGVESLSYALVPPALDQIFIGNMDISRMYGTKCTFIIGANDGVLPANPSDDSVLSEDDRDWLVRNGIELSPSGRERLLDENFLIYLAMASASSKLYLSYPIADAEGKAMLPSPVIKRVEEWFPLHQKKLLINEPEQYSDEAQLDFIVNKHVALSYLASQLRLWKSKYPISDVWWSTYNFLMNEPDKLFTKRILSSLFYKNEVRKLEKQVSQDLYGETLQGSVSRMERFNSCAFSHFASHGLGLKDRQFYKLEAPDIGQLFHSALKLISDRLHELRINWSDVTKKESATLSHEAVNHLAPRLQKEILLSSSRYQYMKEKLEKIIARVVSILSEHAKASGFAPAGLELDFGKKGPLPPMRFQLKSGQTMELTGRIDRIDQAENNGRLLLRIVDYKSSSRGLDLSEVYYGIALQMLTYLDMSVTYSKEWLGTEAVPAGVLYFHIHDPLIQSDVPLGLDEIEKAIYKQFKMKGYLLDDRDAIRLMDQSLTEGRSEIVQAGFKKDGSLRSDSTVVNEEQFRNLRRHIRKTFQTAGEEIMDGKIAIEPYKIKDKMPCTFCSYRSVCQFDESLEENQYRLLASEKDDVILEKLKMEDQEDEEA